MIRVGNDVVDLRDPQCLGKDSDERFIARVFSQDEARAIRDAPLPHLALWVRWAAKEAAFKVVTKLLGSPPPFEHAAFEVQADTVAEPSATLRGRVRYRGTRVGFTADRAPDRIHVLATHGAANGPDQRTHHEVRLFPELAHYSRPEWRTSLRNRFSDQEWRAIHGPGSALVRLRARADLARVLEVEESELEIVCEEGPPGRMPPRIVLRGEDYPGDLSLSHHGRFLAWAFTMPGKE